MFIIIAWLLFSSLALGPPAFIYFYMKGSSKKPWPTKVDSHFQPKLSIIVPTYNEARIILLKLHNLARLNYPKEQTEILVVDSNSTDGTPEIARQFSAKTPQTNLKILTEKERKGKSFALNHALKQCSGDVIIISDADCFWPSEILNKGLPFLADQTVGAIAGPKVLLNSKQTWVTRIEEKYLKSANVTRLGESKNGSTVFFEGGFSAFKREAFTGFDPYSTGSDDCGTVINVIENNYRAMLVPDAEFYSLFPTSFRSKLSIKLRRINQLMRVFVEYFRLLVNGKVKATKKTVIPNILLYLVSPVAFVSMAILTVILSVLFPYLLLFFGLIVVPQVRFYFYEISENNFLLFAAMFGVALGKRFKVWTQPEDRECLTREMLERFSLI